MSWILNSTPLYKIILKSLNITPLIFYDRDEVVICEETFFMQKELKQNFETLCKNNIELLQKIRCQVVYTLTTQF